MDGKAISLPCRAWSSIVNTSHVLPVPQPPAIAVEPTSKVHLASTRPRPIYTYKPPAYTGYLGQASSQGFKLCILGCNFRCTGEHKIYPAQPLVGYLGLVEAARRRAEESFRERRAQDSPCPLIAPLLHTDCSQVRTCLKRCMPQNLPEHRRSLCSRERPLTLGTSSSQGQNICVYLVVDVQVPVCLFVPAPQACQAFIALLVCIAAGSGHPIKPNRKAEALR